MLKRHYSLALAATALLQCVCSAGPIHDASESGDVATVKTLLQESRKTVNAKDAEGRTPIYYANSRQIAELLIRNGARIRVVDNYGVTPLHFAASIGNSDLAQVLRERGVKVTTIHEAALLGDPRVAKKLLARNHKLANKRDWNGDMPVHCAVRDNHIAVAKLLIRYGADLDLGDGDGFTPLISAAELGRFEMVRLLLDKGAKVNARSGIGGDTALHRAALNGHVAVVRLLLSRGADVNAQASVIRLAGQDMTPLEVAEARHQKAAADAIREFIAKKQKTKR